MFSAELLQRYLPEVVAWHVAVKELGVVSQLLVCKKVREAAYQKKVAQLQIGPKKFTEVSEGKVPLQSPINLLKTLVEGVVRERERERKRRAQHTFLPGGASLRSQLILAGGVAQGWRYIVRLPNHLIPQQHQQYRQLPLATTCQFSNGDPIQQFLNITHVTQQWIEQEIIQILLWCWTCNPSSNFPLSFAKAIFCHHKRKQELGIRLNSRGTCTSAQYLGTMPSCSVFRQTVGA